MREQKRKVSGILSDWEAKHTRTHTTTSKKKVNNEFKEKRNQTGLINNQNFKKIQIYKETLNAISLLLFSPIRSVKVSSLVVLLYSYGNLA